MQPVPYTGNSDYCYANSLHMSLLAAGAEPFDLPNPGFLECLTTMPFGKMYIDLPEEPLVFFNSPEVTPDIGLTIAIQSLGWTCQEQRGNPADEALELLREAVRRAPVLAGPVDLGYLTHNPLSSNLAGVDHFVAVLAVEDESVLLHDPAKYPYARLPIAEFMEAWRAERIGYIDTPYTLRMDFECVEKLTRREMIERTVPTIRDHLNAQIQGPVVYSGVHALHRLIQDLRADVKPAGLLNMLTTFVFPLAARRSLDAAFFLQEAGLQDAATCMNEQASLIGKAQYLAVHDHWNDVANLLEQLAEVEAALVRVL